jgi:hypothetical protein
VTPLEKTSPRGDTGNEPVFLPAVPKKAKTVSSLLRFALRFRMSRQTALAFGKSLKTGNPLGHFPISVIQRIE